MNITLIVNRSLISAVVMIACCAPVLQTGCSRSKAIEDKNGQEARVSISETNIILPDGVPGQIVEKEIEIRNIGLGSLMFTIKPTCSCTKISPLSGLIEPNGKQIITVSLQLPNAPNGKKSAVFTVSTNDTISPDVRCVMTGRCPASVKTSPAFIRIYEHPIANPIPKQTIVCRTQDGEAIITKSDISVTATLSTTIVEIVETANNEYGVSVSIDEAEENISHSTDYSDIISVSYKEGAKAEIPYYVRFSAPYRVIPEVVHLPEFDSDGESSVANVLISIKQDVGSLLSIDMPDGINVKQVDSSQKTHVYAITRSRPKINSLKEVVDQDVVLHYSNTDSPIKVKIRDKH